MKYRLARSLAGCCFLFLTASSPAQATDEFAEIDKTGKGAVMCNWMIFVSILRESERCSPGQDQELKQALRTAIADIESFILKNSTISARDLEKHKMRWISSERPQKDVCQQRQFYRLPTKKDIEKLKSDVAELLSIPRKPLWNPCL